MKVYVFPQIRTFLGRISRLCRRSRRRGSSPVETALADWANDDLLITHTARGALKADYPDVAELLDWPALRTLFEAHEAPANMAKRRARAAGRRAVWFSFLALISAALGAHHVGPAGSASAWLWTMLTAIGAASFGVAAFVSGIRLMLHGDRKKAWMVERLWTETLRRFFYQFVIRHADLALEVMSKARPIADWRRAQATALRRLQSSEMLQPEDSLREVLKDEVESKVWTLTEWQTDSILPSVTPGRHLDDLLNVLERKRLQIQKDYTGRKLFGSTLALRGLRSMTRSFFYSLVFLVLGVTVAIGFVRAYGAFEAEVDDLVNFLVTVAAVGSAVIVALQMWDRGERISAETERLEWYLTSVENIHLRYKLSSSPNNKIRALADLETAAYQEMRQFLVSVEQSEFVAG